MQITLVQSMGCNRSKQKEADLEEVSDDDNAKEILKSAENFLKNWSERRDSEKTKTVNVLHNKIPDAIVTNEEDSYVSFTIVTEESEADEDVIKESETTMLLDPEKNSKNVSEKNKVDTNEKAKNNAQYFFKHFM